MIRSTLFLGIPWNRLAITSLLFFAINVASAALAPVAISANSSSLHSVLNVVATSGLSESFAATIPLFNQPELDATPISQTQAEAWFGYLASRSDIPFRYPDDGCYARAHQMVRLMDAAGVISLKLFIFAKAGSTFTIRTRFSPLGYVNWTYHVAPAVLVRTVDGSSSQMQIIDPSLSNSIMSPDAWINLVASRIPYQSNYFPRFAYSKDKPYYDFWLEEDIANAEQTNQFFVAAEKRRGFNRREVIAFRGDGAFLFSKNEVVRSIVDAGDHFKITLARSPGEYRLRKSTVGFERVSQRLNQSLTSKTPIFLSIDALNLEIQTSQETPLHL